VPGTYVVLFSTCVRLITTAPSNQIKNSSYTDGGFGLCVDYFAFPWLRRKIDPAFGMDSTRGYYLWLRGGYLYSSTPKDVVDPISENTILTEANARFYLPYEIMLTNKNRVDWRIVNGDF